MTTDISTLLAKHPSVIHADAIQDMIKPLKNIGISYFSHARIYSDGSLVTNASSPEFFSFYHQQEFYNFDIHLSSLDCNKSYVLWDLVPHYGKTEELYRLGAQFGVFHTFTIMQPSFTTNNFYHFAVKQGNDHMNQVYLSNIDLLEKFIQHYSVCLANDSELQQAIDLAFKPDCNSGGYFSHSTADDIDRQEFLKCIQQTKQTFHLSRREQQCLQLLAKGYTAKSIGRELQLSPKTIYFYLDNLKKKAGLRTKSELVKYYWDNYG